MKIALCVSFIFLNFIYVAESGRRRLPTASVLVANELTAEEKQYIVDEVNLRRGQVDPPATNMIRLQYDDDVADVAKDFTRECRFDNNDMPFTDKFSWLGEVFYSTTSIDSNRVVIRKAINSWFQQRNFYNFDTQECRPGKSCGTYTELVWAENTSIGCGITTCRNMMVRGKLRPRMTIFVCNVGPGGNYIGEDPYRSGTSCSQCPPGEDCVCNS